MRVTLVLLGALACSLPRGPEQVPLPPFAVELRAAESTVYDFEVSFEPGAGHDLDQVRAFYVSWAGLNGWRQVSSSEEDWAADEWQSFGDAGGRAVRQRLAHWVDPTGARSLRLALMHFPDTDEQRAVVFVHPFDLIPNAVDTSASLRQESPNDWRRGPSRVEFRFLREVPSGTTLLINNKFYAFDSEPFLVETDLDSVTVDRRQETCAVDVAFEAGSEERLRVITSRRLGQTVGVFADGKLLWVAGLGGPITTEVTIWTKSCEEAEDLAGRMALQPG